MTQPDSPAGGSPTPKPTDKNVPDQKPADAHDTSAAGEEDPGAAVEEMDDPHPDARPPGKAP